MLKVYEICDDAVRIIESNMSATEIDCYESVVVINFSDGTIITVGFPKDHRMIWWIKRNKRGSAQQELRVCENEWTSVSGDVLYIDAKLVSYEVFNSSEGGYAYRSESNYGCAESNEMRGRCRSCNCR